MAGFISVDKQLSDVTWSSANWIYRSYLTCVIDGAVDLTPKAIELITSGLHNQFVDLRRVAIESNSPYDSIVTVFADTCYRVSRGECTASVDGNELNDENQGLFKKSVEGLASLLVAQRE